MVQFSIPIVLKQINAKAISDPYAKICVSDKIKSTNVKVFNLISRTNETRHIK